MCLSLVTCVAGCAYTCFFTVGLNDLKGLFQPKLFYDSVCARMRMCVSIGNTCSALLLAGPEEMGLWQPRLCWAIGFGSS